MTARDRQTAGAMRVVLAALENAEALPAGASPASTAWSEHVAGGTVGLGAGEAPRRVLSPEDERDLIDREVAEMRSSAATLAEAGGHERAAELLRVADIVEHAVTGRGGPHHGPQGL